MNELEIRARVEKEVAKLFACQVANKERENHGEAPEYHSDAFFAIADNLHELAEEAKKKGL